MKAGRARSRHDKPGEEDEKIAELAEEEKKVARSFDGAIRNWGEMLGPAASTWRT